jgi:phosphodiesterase/alkaline phosphatase D-like protein
VVSGGTGGEVGTGGVLGTGGAGGVGRMGGLGGSVAACNDPASADFPNGVAAGDVDPSSVVLWARASCGEALRFEYGRDPDFQTPDGCVDVEVVVEDGYIIPSKAPITGLLDGTQYHYRACSGSCASASAQECGVRGSFRTPHASGRHGLRFGVSSCFVGDLRPFVSIKNVPERDLEFFVALGETVYADEAETLENFRKFHDAALIMLDTRSFRTEPVQPLDLPPLITLPATAWDQERSMLGGKQLDDLKRDLQDAESGGITWKFVLVPEPIQNLGWFAAADRFESYPYERGLILDFIEDQHLGHQHWPRCLP